MEATKTSIEATCPECRGPLSVVRNDELVEFRCLVGHAYSARSLLQQHSETQEEVLWRAVVVLEETVKLVDAVAAEFPATVAAGLEAQARTKHRQAGEIRKILEQLEPFRIE